MNAKASAVQCTFDINAILSEVLRWDAPTGDEVAKKKSDQSETPDDLEYRMLVDNTGLGTCPERKLILAILERAIMDFQHATRKGRRCAAHEWFASEDTSWCYSFVPICHVLDVDPDYFRRGLREWTAQCRKPYRRPRQWRVNHVVQSRKMVHTERAFQPTKARRK